MNTGKTGKRVQRGEHRNMRGTHISNSERQHRQPSRVRGTTPKSSRPSRSARVAQNSKTVSEPVVNSFYALWKPYGIVARYEGGRSKKTLDRLAPIEGLLPVGYIDTATEGLLLLTNNTRFRYGLNHSKSIEQRLFLAQVKLPDGVDDIDDGALAALNLGVVLSDGKTLPMDVEVIESPDLPERPLPLPEGIRTCWLSITCSEGWSKHIRRVTAAVGYPTIRLVQWALGPVSLYQMAPGQMRELSHEEKRWAKSVIERTPAPQNPAERRVMQRLANKRQKEREARWVAKRNREE